MKAFKKLSTALKHAGQGPVLRVGDFYIVGGDKFTEFAVIDSESHRTTGHITATKLDGLGNGNWATADPKWTSDKSAFDETS